MAYVLTFEISTGDGKHIEKEFEADIDKVQEVKNRIIDNQEDYFDCGYFWYILSDSEELYQEVDEHNICWDTVKLEEIGDWENLVNLPMIVSEVSETYDEMQEALGLEELYKDLITDEDLKSYINTEKNKLLNDLKFMTLGEMKYTIERMNKISDLAKLAREKSL